MKFRAALLQLCTCALPNEQGMYLPIKNREPLCSACHSLVTEGYATIERHGHEIRFFFGDGSAYVSQNHSLLTRDDSATPHPQRENWGAQDCFADQDDTCVPV